MRKITLLTVLVLFVGYLAAQNINSSNVPVTKTSALTAAKSSHNKTHHVASISDNRTKVNLLTEGFEVLPFPPSGWSKTTTLAPTWDSSDTYFHSGSLGAYCSWTAAGNQDEKLITPVLNFTGMTHPTVAFWFDASKYWSVYPYDNYDLKILISTNGGTTWSAPLWSEESLDTNTWANWEWREVILALDTYAGQSNVKIAFQYTGNDGADLGLDDVTVYDLPSTDVGVFAVTSPKTGCSLSATEQVKVTLKNYGASAVANIPVHYKFNNGTTADGTYTPSIPVGGTAEFTFTQTVDASAFRTDSIVAWTSASGDGNAANDYGPTYYFANIQQGTVPVNVGFEASEDLLGYLIIDNNSDGTTWGIGNTDSLAHSGSNFLVYVYSAANQADDYVFTKCLTLNPGTYNVSFWCRAKSSDYAESLELKYGTLQTVAGMTNSVVNLASITNMSYTQSSTNINITTAGTYYFGFHCNSIADMWALFVDDFSITVAGGIEENGKAIISIYPNPVKDALYVESTDNIEEISMLNTLGQTVYSSQVNNMNYTLNTSALNEGVYFIKLKNCCRIYNP